MNNRLQAILSHVCLKTKEADLVIKNARVLDVFTGTNYEGDVAIAQGYIAGIGDYRGKKEVDAKGQFLVPGFIDAHLHLESTMVSPHELITTAALKGTTSFIVDPHEACNVSGKEGIDYILNQSEKSPANVFLMLPSCVPATEIDDNGADFTAEEMKEYLNHPRILGLGEVMDDYSVIHRKKSMMDKLRLFSHHILDGHAPFLPKEDLQAYALAGIQTDHEAIDFNYALQEVRAGMHIHVREGSAARNLEALVKGILSNKVDTRAFSFCTDDKHIEDILSEGHISHAVRKAIALGLPVANAYQMATINTAECYGLSHLGAITVGRQADFLLISDLEKVKINAVFHKGKEVVESEHLTIPRCPAKLKRTVHLSPLKPEAFRLPISKQEANVIAMEEGQITTKRLQVMLKRSANFTGEEYPEYQKIAVVERHRRSGKIGLGICQGYGIHGGAIASSVCHDSHNLIVIGDNDRDMCLAINELIRSQGGFVLVQEGKVYDALPLPIMGLMCDCGFTEASKHLENMKKKAHEMGVPNGMDPFISLSFLALPVIPEIRITPRGLCLVQNGRPRLIQ